jgi:phospholipase/lecithinase/hemolysin
MFQKVNDLYEHGARHFLFIYVPTIENAPLNKNNSLNFTSSDTTYFNIQVKNNGRDFFNAHPDTNVLIYDSFMEFQYIMDNKEKFGIDNITDSCENSGNGNCGTSDETHFWHNDLHPSYRVQEALGSDIHEFLTSKQVTRNLRAQESAAFNLSVNFKSVLLLNAILLLTLLFI